MQAHRCRVRLAMRVDGLTCMFELDGMLCSVPREWSERCGGTWSVVGGAGCRWKQCKPWKTRSGPWSSFFGPAEIKGGATTVE